MKRTTSSMPSKQKIFDYWYKKDRNMFYKNIDWSLHEDNEWDDHVNVMGRKESTYFFCFACGFSKTIERAHIIPVCDGGSDDLDNLHLLCHKCHLLTEGMVEKDNKFSRFQYDSYIQNTPHYRGLLENCFNLGTKEYIENVDKETRLRELRNTLRERGCSEELINSTLERC